MHLDFTRPVSHGLDLLRYHLEESCNSIREHAGRIDQRCYVLHRYVRKFYTNVGIQGCTLESISEGLEGNSHLLPSNPTELLPLFQTLHDKGQVLLLRNNPNPGKSWVITDIAALLETVIGSIFAPPDFPTHISLGSTRVVTESRIRECVNPICLALYSVVKVKKSKSMRNWRVTHSLPCSYDEHITVTPHVQFINLQ